MAQWIKAQSRNPKVVGSSHAVSNVLWVLRQGTLLQLSLSTQVLNGELLGRNIWSACRAMYMAALIGYKVAIIITVL